MGYKIPLMNCLTGGNVNTRYYSIMNCEGVLSVSEAAANTPFFIDGTLSNLFANVWANASTGTSTVSIRKNGADGNMTLSIAAGATGRFYDNTNTDSVVNGDVANIKLTAGGGGSIQLGMVGAFYETLSGVIVNKIGVGGSVAETSVTRTWAMIGALDAVTETAPYQPRVDIACTAKNLHASLNSNNRTTATTVRTRKNNANGGITLNIPANVAGLHSTTSGSDSLSPGDTLNFQKLPGGGTGTNVFYYVGVELHYPANSFQIYSANTGGLVFAATAARYLIDCGSYSTNGSEGVASHRMYGSGTIKNTYVYCNTSNASATTNIILRKNSTSTALSVAIPATTNGEFSNTVNSATFADSDSINYMYSKPTGTGGQTYWWLATTVEFDLPPPANDPYPQTVTMG